MILLAEGAKQCFCEVPKEGKYSLTPYARIGEDTLLTKIRYFIYPCCFYLSFAAEGSRWPTAEAVPILVW